MASMFQNAKGILMIDCLPKGPTMNGEYYIELIEQLRQNVQQKIILHHDKLMASHQRYCYG